MNFKNLPKMKHGVIVDIDNYTNEHLSDPIFLKYLIKFSEQGGASAFLSKNIENLKILKQNTDLPILAEVEEDFNDILIPKTYESFKSIIDLDPDFIVIEFLNFGTDFRELEFLIKNIRNNFSGELVGKILNKSHAVEAYRLGLDAILIEVFGDNTENKLISEIYNYINMPIIVSLNSVDFDQSRRLIELGVHSFILGEDVTNPNKIIKQFVM